MKEKPWIIHPILFAIYPVLFMLSHNISELSVRIVRFPLFITLLFFSLTWISLYFVLKNKHKRGLVISLFFLLFFSYGHIINFSFRGKDSILFLLLYLSLLAVLIYLIIKTKKDLVNFSKILNYISIFLVAFSVFNITYYEIKNRSKQIIINQDISNIKITRKDKTKYPDIYYLIFDRYTSSENLINFLGFDNSDFENYLKNKGFFIPGRCMTNYPYTFLSLASSLNMEYINYLFYIAGPNSTDRTPAYILLRNNKVVRFLKSIGYKYYHLGSWWGPTRKSKNADENFIYPNKIKLDLDEFSFKLFKTTIAYSAILNFFPNLLFNKNEKNIANIDANRILYKFNQFKYIPYKKGPKFVFAHFLSTHPPYFFDKSGQRFTKDQQLNDIDKKTWGCKKEIKLYLESIEFTNTKIKELVNNILSNSSTTPIIIIQSDEGPVFKYWTKNTSKYLNMRAGIFCALYFPNVDKKALKRLVTPVNIFRFVFNHYLGTSLPYFKNIVYRYKSKKDIYSFKNITRLLRKKKHGIKQIKREKMTNQ